jgi:hypothetical protein
LANGQVSWIHYNRHARPRVDPDQVGVVTLPNLPSGEHTLRFESPQYEPTTRDVSSAPGQTVDLGDVVMQLATGRIVVRILNRDPEEEYFVRLLIPSFAGSGFSVWGIKSDEHVIEHVPIRPYQAFLGLSSGSGGPIPNPTIEFEGDTAVFEVDVAQLPEPRHRSD